MKKSAFFSVVKARIEKVSVGFEFVSLLSSRHHNLFFFFFGLAVCGYIALMVSGCPYNDDYCRYFANKPVGISVGLRYITLILEKLMYLSTSVTDAAPFTQLISCAFLACSATLCLHILGVDTADKWAVLCCFPVVINPYLLEVMMYHFDSPFITLALLLVVLAAYFASFNDKKWLLLQTILLFSSLFLYQAAFSAYFVVFLYKFIKEIEQQVSSKKSFSETVFKMRYWIYSILICFICYAPLLKLLSYCRDPKDGIFIIPTNFENCSLIIKNIARYFSIMYSDWSVNLAGLIFLHLILFFAIISFVKVWRIGKFSYLTSTVTVIFILFLLLLSPCGVYPFLHVAIFKGNTSILPRVMYSVGILIAIALHDNYLTFKRLGNGLTRFYISIITVLGIWTIVFLNSAGNTIHYFRILEQLVTYDVSKDIFEITQINKNISEICIVGSVESSAMRNFSREYPMIERIIPEKWSAPTYCRMALMNPSFYQFLEGTGKNYRELQYRSKNKIKETMWYDVYITDSKLLLFELKGKSKWSSPIVPIVKLPNRS